MYRFPDGVLVLVDLRVSVINFPRSPIRSLTNVPMTVCALEPGQTQIYTVATPLVRVRWDVPGGTTVYYEVPLDAIQNAAEFQGEAKPRRSKIQWAQTPLVGEVVLVQSLLPYGTALANGQPDGTSFLVVNTRGQYVSLPVETIDEISNLPFILGVFDEPTEGEAVP
jgi:hypothetical protein